MQITNRNTCNNLLNMRYHVVCVSMIYRGKITVMHGFTVVQAIFCFPIKKKNKVVQRKYSCSVFALFYFLYTELMALVAFLAFSFF